VVFRRWSLSKGTHTLEDFIVSVYHFQFPFSQFPVAWSILYNGLGNSVQVYVRICMHMYEKTPEG